MPRALPILLALLALAAPPARAAHPEVPLTFDEALLGAAAAPAVVGAGEAAAVKAALNDRIGRATENPEVSVASGYRMLPASDRDGELHLGVQQGWNLSGLRGARRAAAAEEHGVLVAEARARALLQRRGAAEAWVRLWTAEAAFAGVVRELAVATELERALATAAERGVVTAADRADATAFREEVALARVMAEGEVFDASVTLAREAALEPGLLPRTAGPPPAPALPDEEACAALVRRVDALPAVRVAALRARAEEARAEETRAAAGTRLVAGLSVQRDAPAGLLALGHLGVSWGALDRGERTRGEQLAQARRLEGEHAAARQEAGHLLTAVLHEVEHAREREASLRGGVLPALRDVAALRQRELEAGQGTVVEVLQARRRVVAAEREVARAQGERLRAELAAWLVLSVLEEGP